jgi:hypothetical protein
VTSVALIPFALRVLTAMSFQPSFQPLVESRCGAVVIGSAYRFPALSVAGVSLASPWLRFHIPLIKPGGPFSGTRLSDKALRHLLLHTFAHEQSPLGSLELV